MRIGIDIDGTITNETIGWNYEARTPVPDVIEKINQLYDQGHWISLHTSRLKRDRKVTEDWLKLNGVKYNEVIFEKPKYDIYVGDEIASIHYFIKMEFDL
jgi:uncharacterized HAD superfamily protein